MLRPDLLPDPVRDALAGWPHSDSVAVAEIDPELADTAACAEAYRVPWTLLAGVARWSRGARFPVHHSGPGC